MVAPRFPLAHTVTHYRTPAAVAQNALGQHIATRAAPVTRRVYGWRPKSTGEGADAPYGERVVTELYLLTPDGDYKPGQEVGVAGRVYEVVGDPEDFTTGPFGYRPGYRYTLRRVTDG